MLPLGADLEVVVGDLDDRSSLDAALERVDAAFLTTPHGERDAELGLELLAAACDHAEVSRFVLCTAIDVENSNRLVRDAILWVMGRIGPHYAAKYRVEVVAAGRDSDLDTVVLQPTTSPRAICSGAASCSRAPTCNRYQGREPGGLPGHR